jgi:ribosomal protein L37AE/L43A
MSYAVIVRKKIRMCGRFGHLAEAVASRRLPALTRAGTPVYYCQRCGALVPRTRGSR